MSELTSEQFSLKTRIQHYINAFNRIAYFDHITAGSAVFDRRGNAGTVLAIVERETLSRNGYLYVCEVQMHNGRIEQIQPDYLTPKVPMYALDVKLPYLGDDTFDPAIHTQNYFETLQRPVFDWAMAAE